MTVEISNGVAEFINKHSEETGLYRSRIIFNALALYKLVSDKGAIRGNTRLVLIDKERNISEEIKFD